MQAHWSLAELLGYISTWSAARGAREAGREDLLLAFADEMAAAWGDPHIKRSITWPIKMRVGRVA